MSIVSLLLLALCAGFPSKVHAVDVGTQLDNDRYSSLFLTREHVSSILQTTLDDDDGADIFMHDNGRRLQEDAAW